MTPYYFKSAPKITVFYETIPELTCVSGHPVSLATLAPLPQGM